MGVGDNSEQIQVSITAKIAGLMEGLTAATAGVKESTSAMASSFEGLGAAVKGLAAPVMGITALLAGGSMFKKAIGETVDWAMEVNKLSKSMSINMQDASAWAVMLHTLGISGDQMSGVMQRLQVRMATGGKAFQQYGIATKDVHGALLPTASVMEEITNKYASLSTQTEKNAMLAALFGRSWMQVVPLMRATSAALEDARKEAEDLGLEVGADGVAKARAYTEGMNKVHMVILSLANHIGQALMPALTDMSRWFAQNGATMVKGLSDAFSVLGAVLSSTTVRIALVVGALVALRGPLLAAATGALNFGKAIGEVASMTAAFGAEGFAASIVGLINPWMLLAAAVVGAGVAYEYWMGTEDRARDARKKETDAVTEGVDKYTALTKKLQEADDTLKNTVAGTQAHTDAENKKKVIIDQLVAIYPEFNGLLKDENGYERDTADLIAKANQQKAQEVQKNIEVAQSTLAELQAKEALLEVEAKSVASAPRAREAANSFAFFGATVESQSEKVRASIKSQIDNINDLIAKVKELQASPVKDATGEGGGDGANTTRNTPKDDSGEQMQAMRQNLEEVKSWRENLYTWSAQRELEYWQTMATMGGLGVKAQEEIATEIARARTKAAEEGEKNAEKRFERQYSAAERGSAERVQMATQEVARVGAIYQRQGAEYEAAQARMAEAGREFTAAQFEDQKKATDASVQSQVRLLESSLRTSEQEAQAGRISKAQLLQDQIDFENKRYEIEQDAAMAEALLEPDPSKVQAIWQRIEAMDAAHQQRLYQIDQLGADERTRVAREWTAGLTSGFESATAGLIKGTQSWGNAFRSVMGSAVDFAVRQMYSMLARHIAVEFSKTAATHTGNTARTASDVAHASASMAADAATGATHATVEGAKTGATLAGTTARVAAEIWASVTTMAKKIAEGISWIAVEGWKAAASAWTSICAIPVVGPFLAPAVAAGVLASVIGLGAHLASASGGWERVPNDQLAMIHKDEQVLPAGYAEGLRKLVANGGNGAGGAGGGEVHVHMHGTVIDGAFWKQHQGNIVSTIQDAIKNRRG